MGETGSLVVLREDEDLGLSGQPSEGGGVEDSVTVPLEAGSEKIGSLLDQAVTGSSGKGGAVGQEAHFLVFPGRSIHGSRETDCGPTVVVGGPDLIVAVPVHGRSPQGSPWSLRGAYGVGVVLGHRTTLGRPGVHRARWSRSVGSQHVPVRR